MDLDETITVTKIITNKEKLYVIIGWQKNSFEMYLFCNESIWKGRFSSNRLANFSKTLQISEVDYLKKLKYCLSHQKSDYVYEFKNAFFYWKKKEDDAFIIEGFLPVEQVTSKKSQPDLVEVLLALNKQLIRKASHWENKCKHICKEYQKCIKDTEEFLNLKIDMEKALCDKFLTLLNLKKSKAAKNHEDKEHVKYEDIQHLLTSEYKGIE